MLRKLPFLALLIFLTIFVKAEFHITMDLQHCLNGSTHIFKGKVISEDGLIEINSMIKGDGFPKTLRVQGTKDLKYFVGYIPDNIMGWELLIFLNRNEKGEWLPINYFDLPMERGFELALSIMWIKDNKYFIGIQIDNPGPVEFLPCCLVDKKDTYILNYVQLQTEIAIIKTSSNCRKKIKTLEEIYDSTQLKALVYMEMKEADCVKHWRKYLKNIVLDDQFDIEQREALEDYIPIGRPKVIDKIFTSELDFWKEYTAENENAKWWIYKEPQGKRFVYFKVLIFTIAGNKQPGWRDKCEQVIKLFSQLPNYNADSKAEQIHDSLKRYYLN